MDSPPHPTHCSVRLCVCVCAQVHVCVCVCERERERQLSPKAILVNGKVLNICKWISELYRTKRYLFQNSLGVFGVCSRLVNFHCGQSCPVSHSSPAHFKWHDLIKHFSTFNCMPRPQGIICWVAPSGLNRGRKDTSVQKGLCLTLFSSMIPSATWQSLPVIMNEPVLASDVF